MRFALLLLLLTSCRIFFLFFNFSYFSTLPLKEILLSFIWGIRFDIVAITIGNILFITLHLLPFRFFYSRIYQGILKFLFIIINGMLLLFNCIDMGLFRFTGKHATIDAIRIMGFGEDLVNTAPKMISDFWYLLLLFITFVLLMLKLFPASTGKPEVKKPIVFEIILWLAFASLTLIGFRGGLQYKPLNILSAAQYGSSKNAALILNTPFTIFKTYGKNSLQPISYYPENLSRTESPYIHNPDPEKKFQPYNIILLIVESLGKEYIGSLNNYPGYTPFLDSLINESLVYTNAYANGKRSIEGVPAIVAGIPALMTEPFISSAYSANSISTIAGLLKTKNYSTVFFHGGTNGTMGFENFSKKSGYDRYYGRREYNNDKDFDGSWGIFDEPFLLRSTEEINKLPLPFFATIFTLSSHHPYRIPDQYTGKFEEGTLPIHRSIRYADYSIKKFFETIKTQPYYNNTVFIITGDHTALSDKEFYQTRTGMYSTPIIYFAPSIIPKGISTTASQHIDILPWIMNIIGYDYPYFSYGNIKDSSDNIAVSFLNDTYQAISGEYSLVLDTTGKSSLYHFTSDSTLSKDITSAENIVAKKLERKLRAFIQNFNNTMINNQMTAH
jgi:phosphoglycerol transferase MdoB-like AlkP superfamily enzyme